MGDDLLASIKAYKSQNAPSTLPKKSQPSNSTLHRSSMMEDSVDQEARLKGSNYGSWNPGGSVLMRGLGDTEEEEEDFDIFFWLEGWRAAQEVRFDHV